MRTRLALTVIILAGCRGDAPTPTKPPAAGSGSAPIATVAADAAVIAIDATLVEHMRAHFAAVSDLQRALARGDLDKAKADARWIVAHEEPNQLAEWASYVAELKGAASEVVAAPDVPTAAGLVSRLGRACSRCHEQTAAVVTFAWDEPPVAGPDLASQMRRHQWSASRLWEGLVGPADDVWKQGARTLATTQLDMAAAAGSTPRGDVAALAARVRTLATKAAGLEEQDDRAALYGELLSTCAGCHALVRPGVVRDPR
jgi:hypothetical protein